MNMLKFFIVIILMFVILYSSWRLIFRVSKLNLEELEFCLSMYYCEILTKYINPELYKKINSMNNSEKKEQLKGSSGFYKIFMPKTIISILVLSIMVQIISILLIYGEISIEQISLAINIMSMFSTTYTILAFYMTIMALFDEYNRRAVDNTIQQENSTNLDGVNECIDKIDEIQKSINYLHKMSEKRCEDLRNENYKLRKENMKLYKIKEENCR